MTDNPSTSNAFNQPRYWLLWVLATIGGWLGGTALNIVLSLLLNMTGLGDAVNANPDQISQETALILMGVSLIIFVIIGASVGGMQWLVLRRQMTGLQRWAIFTGLGFAAGSFVSLAFMGLGVGLMQWLILRRDLNKTGWWPVMNTVAWPLGYLFGSRLGTLVGDALGMPLLGTLVSAVVIGAIIGAITGAVLLWTLRENRVLLDGLREEAEQAKA